MCDVSGPLAAAINAQAAQLREIETWLAMLIVRYGMRTDLGFRYELTVEEAEVLRGLLVRSSDPRVLISANLDGVYTLDTL